MNNYGACFALLQEKEGLGFFAIQQGKLVYASRGLGAALGLSDEPGEGPVMKLLQTIVDELAGSEATQVGPRRVVIKPNSSGDARYLDVFSTHQLHGPDQLVCGLILDRTAAQQVAEHQRHAQRLEAVGTLASGIAHDFGNILAAIDANVHFILDDTSPAAAELRDAARDILNAKERAASLVRQLLAFSHKRPVTRAEFDLVATARQLEPMLRRLLPSSIQLRLVASSPIASVIGDEHQMEQVIINLVVNARDAMPDGGVLVIAVTADEQRAQLTVSDTGSGMSPEVLKRAFEPFFTTKAPGQGTGLGLSAVKGIVEQHGGRIELSSSTGDGTVAAIILPAGHR